MSFALTDAAESCRSAPLESREIAGVGLRDARALAGAERSADTAAFLGVDEMTLQVWIARVARRDEAALAEIYRALMGRIFGLAVRIVRDAQAAEEVTEDVFWQVWRQAQAFDPSRGSAGAWLMTIARSRALDTHRAHRRANAKVVSIENMGAGAFDDAGLECELVGDAGTAHGPGGLGADPLDVIGAQQESLEVSKCLGQRRAERHFHLPEIGLVLARCTR